MSFTPGVDKNGRPIERNQQVAFNDVRPGQHSAERVGTVVARRLIHRGSTIMDYGVLLPDGRLLWRAQYELEALEWAPLPTP